MAKGNGSSKFTCECNLTFKDRLKLLDHARQAGHMKSSTCVKCCRVFATAESLHQHNAAFKHKKPPVPVAAGVASSSTPAKTTPNTAAAAASKPAAAVSTANAPARKATSGPKPVSAASKPAPAVQAPKAAVKKNQPGIAAPPTKPAAPTNTPKLLGGVPVQKEPPRPPVKVAPTPSGSSSAQGAVVLAKMPGAPYAWVSAPVGNEFLGALIDRCHSEELLLSQGYYTGPVAGRKPPNFNVRGFFPTPRWNSAVPKRDAVAIDCEMVGVGPRGCRSSLARISAVDMLTGEVLIDQLVVPNAPVTDWRTKYSGITKEMMRQAQVSGRAFASWTAARRELFRFVDITTVLVGHSLQHDLRVLGTWHERVVDTALLAAEAVFGRGQQLSRIMSLRELCHDLLGVAVQGAKTGHDSLEDALATRELAILCVACPGALVPWAATARAQYEAKVERQRREREERRALREKKKAERLARGFDSSDDYDCYSDREFLVMTEAEFLDQIEYPPGYDNFSD